MNWIIPIVTCIVCTSIGFLIGNENGIALCKLNHRKPTLPITDMERYVDFCESVWITNTESHSGLTGGLDISTQVMTLGLSGEVGEVMEWIKKYVRDGSDDKSLLLKEFGDVQYYLYMLARRFGFSVNDVVAANVEKLQGRVQRGTQRGSGDNR